MGASDEIADRDVFAERVRIQLAARHPQLTVAADTGRYGLRLTGPSVDVRLPLHPLQAACMRDPSHAARLIADFVRQTETGITPMTPSAVPLARLTWCVRTTEYLSDHSREGDLLVRPVAGSLVAFVVEQLPNSIMRGVPREEWAAHGEEAVVAAADATTAARFATTAKRIREAGRVPRDGWQFNGDALFQASAMLVPEVRRALVERAGGDVLLATPDRSLLLAVPADSEGAANFRRRVRRTWREAFNPCSAEVIGTDGESLFAVEAPQRHARAGLMRMFER
jgi:hypothetical protein